MEKFPGLDIYDSKTKKIYTISLAVGFYDTIPRILKEFNAKCIVTPRISRMSLVYNNITNRVIFSGAEGYSLTFKGRLAVMLGFNPGEAVNIPATLNLKKQHTAPHPADIHAGRYNIFIYSDIVNYQLVGDSSVPLLQCINASDKPRRMPTLTYDKPHHTSLSKTVIDDIEISLKNNQNQYIPFAR